MPVAKRKHRATGQPKGHWPAGKRRNPAPPRGFVAALRRSLNRRGVRGTGAAIGVDPRAIYRWIDGTHFPAPEIVLTVMGLE